MMASTARARSPSSDGWYANLVGSPGRVSAGLTVGVAVRVSLIVAGCVPCRRGRYRKLRASQPRPGNTLPASQAPETRAGWRTDCLRSERADDLQVAVADGPEREI